MLKSDLKEYLKDNVVEDALYLEEALETTGGEKCIKCLVWSASAGYTFTYTRIINTVNNRNIQATRKLFIKHLMKDKPKFSPRFDFTDDLYSGLEVLFNDGFEYEQE